jgi:hypothetical protein
MRPDIVVYSKDEKPQLIIEVKQQARVSAEWAAQMRRNLLVHAVVPPSPFFLLVLPDRLYLWKHATSLEAVPADYEIDVSGTLAPYVASSQLTLDSLSEYSLELIVVSWLNDLILAALPRQREEAALDWLYDSGLYDAIKDGSVLTEPVL